jgi:hypothetical protein
MKGGFQFSQQKVESWKKMVKFVKGMKFPLLWQQNFNRRWGKKPKVGKSSKLSRLKHLSMSGEEKMSMLSSFKSVSKEEYSIGNSSKSSFLDTSTEGKEILLDITTGVSRVESGN